MKKLYILFFSLACTLSFGQKTENVFLITTDGLRWQDVFAGADSAILFNKTFTPDSADAVTEFWSKSISERKNKLMPFLWSTVAAKGQIYGNRWKGDFMDVDNIYRFSYPGYNELLSGYADVEINSNDKNYNKNITVLEFLNQQEKLKGKVAAFSTWDVFPYIINDKRSGVPVNAGHALVSGKLSPKQELLNEIQQMAPHAKAERHDFITYFQAKEYIHLNKPRVMFISLDDTDGYAHAGKYKEYLRSAKAFDKYLSDLWAYCQSVPQYRDKTTFIITTDHGRGDIVKTEWTSHGQRIRDAAQIWMAVIGPDTPALGEISTKQNLFQNQIAKTLADLLGYNFENGKQIGQKIEGVKRKEF